MAAHDALAMSTDVTLGLLADAATTQLVPEPSHGSDLVQVRCIHGTKLLVGVWWASGGLAGDLVRVGIVSRKPIEPSLFDMFS